MHALHLHTETEFWSFWSAVCHTTHDLVLIPCFQAYGDEDYLIFDCPGQIELYSHVPVMRSFVEYLGRQGYTMAVVYCLDAQFASDGSKFVAGSLQALSAMVQLELPHVNVLTKVDLLAPDSKVQIRAELAK